MHSKKSVTSLSINNKKVSLLLKEGEGLELEYKEKYSSKIVQDIVALANSKGGRILLGISDQGEVVGERLTNSMKAEIFDLGRNCDPSIHLKVYQCDQVVVIEVGESSDKPHMCSTGFYKRYDAVSQKLKTTEVKQLFKSKLQEGFDSQPVIDMKIKDISVLKVRQFIKEAKLDIKMNRANLSDFLESLGLLKDDKLNQAAAMLFANNIEKFLRHCQVHLVAFKGIDRVHIYDKKYVRNDLLTQFNESIDFCKKHLNERAEIRGVRRYDLLEIPMEAIREAIVNAIIHRDYSLSGTNIEVYIFDDRVEISSPGGIPNGLQKSELGRKSVRRNEILADLFHRMDKIEKVGSGIPRINKLLKEAEAKPAIFETGGFFTVTFARDSELSMKDLDSSPKGKDSSPKGKDSSPKGKDSSPKGLNAKVRETKRANPKLIMLAILEFCSEERTIEDILLALGRKDRDKIRKNYLSKLLVSGKLKLKYPDKINHPGQAYITSRSGHKNKREKT